MPFVNLTPAKTVEGSPCKTCGGTTRKASNRSCLACERLKQRERNSRRRKADPEKYRQQAREWRANNPDKLKRYERASLLAGKFGLTPSDYDSMLAAQNGVCAICAAVCKSGRALAVDHCHSTGAIRALLCMNCNNGLGRFRDQPALLRAAADYLEKHGNG